MTNPDFLAQEIPDDPSSWTLSGEEARHARVVRIAPGEGIGVVDGRDEDAIEMATEVGADVVVPWQAERSIAQWAPAKARRAAARWESRLRAATKQSRRSRIPTLLPLHDSRAVARLVARTCEEGGTALVLHESATTPLHHVALSGDVLVVVGPEGGVSPRELEALAAAGATAVVAGPHVMRSGTAGPVAVSHLARTVGRWGTPGRIGATAPERPA